MKIERNVNKNLIREGTVKKKTSMSVLIGAAFLMATSSIGPGFLTQTTVFTQQLAASFGFVILISLLLDVFAQMNVWRIIAVSGLRGQEIANKVLPGLGVLLAVLIVMGGLAFNIGNIAGAGLGLNAMLGIDPTKGALISAAFAIFISSDKDTPSELCPGQSPNNSDGEELSSLTKRNLSNLSTSLKVVKTICQWYN